MCAVRYDASPDALLRTSGAVLDYNTPYTLMGWFMPVANPSDQMWLVVYTGDWQNADMFRRPGAGTSTRLDIYMGGGGSGTNGAVAYNASGWNHFTMVRESDTVIKAYQDGVLTITHTHASFSGRTASTAMGTGENPTGPRFDGRVYGMKAWQVALTAEQVMNEMRTLRPQYLTSLWGWWPILPGSGERTRDYSGNGRDWTEVGTLTEEDPAPVSWGTPILPVVTSITVTTVVSFMYTPYKERIAKAQADLDGIDLRAILVMEDTSAAEDEDAASLSAITTLDECDGSGYARQPLTAETVTRDDANNRAELHADPTVWATLGTGTRQLQAVLLYEHVDGTAANDRPVAYLVVPEFPLDPGGQTLTVTWDAAAGLFSLGD